MPGRRKIVESEAPAVLDGLNGETTFAEELLFTDFEGYDRRCHVKHI